METISCAALRHVLRLAADPRPHPLTLSALPERDPVLDSDDIDDIVQIVQRQLYCLLPGQHATSKRTKDQNLHRPTSRRARTGLARSLHSLAHSLTHCSSSLTNRIELTNPL